MDVQLAADLARAATAPRPVARESTPVPGNQAPAPSATEGDAAAADSVRANGSGQFYISPFLTFDSRSLTVIFQVRDSESGDVTRQFPAESVVERYRRDPSARPFVLPEPAGQTEEPAGPPPPTIGGPVAEAASEAEQQGSDATGSPPPGSNPPTGGGGQAASDGAGEAFAPPRASVDLVA